MDALFAVVLCSSCQYIASNFFLGGGGGWMGGGVNTSVLFKLMTYCKRTNNHYNSMFNLLIV